MSIEDLKAGLELFARGGRAMFRDHFPLACLLIIATAILTSLFYRERINVLLERISSYQQQLNEAAKEARYASLTNRDLKKEADELVKKLRNFRQEFEAEKRTQTQYYDKQEERTATQTEQQKKDFFQIRSSIMSKIDTREKEQFQREFSALVRTLGAAILERLPKEEKKYNEMVERLTTDTRMLNGIDPVSEIATTLEMLAQQLNIPLHNWFSLRWQDGFFTLFLLIGTLFWSLRQYALWYKQKPLQLRILPPEPTQPTNTISKKDKRP